MASKHAVAENKSLKRIYNDLKENALNPIDGISIFIPDDDDLFHLHCEIKVLYGVYTDVILHTILHIPSNYPIAGPAMNICNDFRLPASFHHHILGSSICNDMLTNFKDYFETIDNGKEFKKASGWSSGYSLNVILSQMQIFFSDPDMPLILTESEIKNLISYSKKYSCQKCKNKNQFKINNEPTNNDDSKTTKLKSNLICGLTKNSLQTDKNILLGYPLMITFQYNKMVPQILTELLSYDGYSLQKKAFERQSDLNRIKMFSPNGDPFNYWLPIYIDEEHFKRGFDLIKNALVVILHGVRDSERISFKPEMAKNVLPCLINKTIVFILNGTIFHSLAAIQSYCHLLRLYYKFLNHFPELKIEIVNDVRKFVSSLANRHKKQFPDLGEFIINLFLSNYSYDAVKQDLYIEFMTRQIFWIEKNASKSLESFPAQNFMNTVFQHSKVANHLLMFNIMSARYFISAERIKQMDENLGFIPDDLMNDFKNVILRIKNVTTYAE